MKNSYIAPEATTVNYAAETMLALSIAVTQGTSGEVAGSNTRNIEDWDEN